MKKLLFAALIGLMISTVASAQYNGSVNTPRYGQTQNRDNTGRVTTYGDIFHNDVASATLDTVLTSVIMLAVAGAEIN